MHLSLLVAAIATFGGTFVGARRPGPGQGLFSGFHLPYPKNVGSANVQSSKRSTGPKNPNIKSATFQQLLDHNNPSLGSFSQRYFYNAEHYAGPGSPVVLMSSGEGGIDGLEYYLGNAALPGMFAQSNGGAVIVLEHRYFGQSSPYQNLTTETFQYLTLDQVIQDHVYFANNVQLPFDPHGSSKPHKAPWIFTGFSYAGALSAWTHHFAPGTFWAYHSSSAPVQTIGDFWQYFRPVDEALPRNCSTDIKRISAHIQEVLTTGSEDAKIRLKTPFAAEMLADDDFVGAIFSAFMGFETQSFTAGYDGVYRTCDWIETDKEKSYKADVMKGFWPETKKTVRPGPEGVGLSESLDNFAKFWTEYFLAQVQSCGDNTSKCYNTHNANALFYTDTSVANSDRQFRWLLCNEALEYSQTGSDASGVGWPPRILSLAYFRQNCYSLFPDINGHRVGMAKGVTGTSVIRRTGGWSMTNTTRLMWVNGENDPWRSASVASDFRPGGRFLGDEDHPSYVIPHGSHCIDALKENADVNEGARKVMEAEMKKMKEWVQDFYKKK
ncbi:hypothetical protein E4U53_007161 [Claviceps sorghi]|nr:hypothetical protein E4U53_007161 [Claviceps sorghi]